MRKRRIYTIQIILSLAIVVGLVTGCAVPSTTSPPSSTPAPPASKYPADISGHVTMAEKVKCFTAIAAPPHRDSDIFWIVDISVKNNTYSDPVEASLMTGYGGWRITANDKVYHPRQSDEELSIALGQTGQFVLYFEVPRSLQVDDAQICYQGQEPYSYGKLNGGDKVVAYDWGSKTVITEPEAAVPSFTEQSRTVIIYSHSYPGDTSSSRWQLVLKDVNWAGNTVELKLEVNFLGDKPTFFGRYLICLDQYGMSFTDLIGSKLEEQKGRDFLEGKSVKLYPIFYQGTYYPGESRAGNLKFEVNKLSGKVWLFLGGTFLDSSKYEIFYLGEPKK